jgi:hypothetical protein
MWLIGYLDKFSGNCAPQAKNGKQQSKLKGGETGDRLRNTPRRVQACRRIVFIFRPTQGEGSGKNKSKSQTSGFVGD